MVESLIVALFVAGLVIFVISRTAIVIPQQSAYVVERLGKYSSTIEAGFHILVPFLDRVRYKHSLKEIAIDIPAQLCITKDNVQVTVDGVLYLKVLDPEKASYGIDDYVYAVTQLAQTALRSEMGRIDLDRTFEERDVINHAVVGHLDKATEPWGVKVLRYEIQNISPPQDIIAAMEEQSKAERKKRAVILASEAEREAVINSAEAEKQRVIRASEAHREEQINRAEGQARAILAVASATAEGLKEVATAIETPGGENAMKLQIAEKFVAEFGKLAKEGNSLIVPANLMDIAGMIKMATTIVKKEN
jgi:regulator of protease activity HflC (stomatin/prohibitin superfamily)